MFEKVNPSHPDKVADRIAGALVDLAYSRQKDPRIAVEVLIGHGVCNIIAETSVHFEFKEVQDIVFRIAEIEDGEMLVYYIEAPQDEHLAENQKGGFRCGDNGIFKGTPVTQEQGHLASIARMIYEDFPTDGKYLIQGDRVAICQSNATEEQIRDIYPQATIVNPLGYWTGGPDVDTGATNRKLGSDMGDSVTGGGLHGKDLSKADVSVNIYAWLMAQIRDEPVEYICTIGAEDVCGVPFVIMVEMARNYINRIGGFEKFAEWGFI